MALFDFLKMQSSPAAGPGLMGAFMGGGATSPAGATPGFNPAATSPPPGGAPSAGPPPAAPAGGGGFMDKLQSPQAKMAMMGLASSLQGMGNNPNQGFQNMMTMGIQNQMNEVQQQRAMEAATQQANQTADYFDSINQPDLANQIRMNPGSAPEVLASYRDQKMKQGQVKTGRELGMEGPGADRYYNVKADGTRTLIQDGSSKGQEINISNMGNIPSGHVMSKDPVTGEISMLPAKGTKLYREMMAQDAAAEAKEEGRAIDYTTGMETIQDVREGFKKSPDLLPGDSVWSGALNSVWRRIKAAPGGTPDAALEASIDTIKSQEGFNKLEQIKNSSPTGAGVGSLSEEEFNNMAAITAKLDLKLDKDTNLKNLERIAKKRFDMVHGPIEAVTARAKAGEYAPGVYEQYLQAWSAAHQKPIPEYAKIGNPGTGPGSGSIGWQDLGNGIQVREVN